ncbi:hypothetical protein AVEN_20930-1 [Araneus ventricosus]|uniref:Uncharacterized protein n=1 Tax=Araneus ventricosus TaxID=182803 RepID=A0A4Y2KP93_ARAVE|nr:hypothetical protein AVEN_20930-1 [Araneus ventricosus]
MSLDYNAAKSRVDVVDKLCTTFNLARNEHMWPTVFFFILLNMSGEGELEKECDIYFAPKQKSLDEGRNDLRRTLSSEKYVPIHQRREISRRDNSILKRKEGFVCGSLLHLARKCLGKRK